MVTNYQEGGNYISLFPENVFPVKLDESMKKELKKQKVKEEEEETRK